MRSIRRNILIALLGAMMAVLLAGAALTYHSALAETNAIFDYHLRQLALSLRDQAFGGPATSLVPPREDFDFVIQVWDRRGIALYYSQPEHGLLDRAQLGFATVTTPEGAWRVFATQLGDLTIQVAQPMQVRDSLATTAALRSVLPFLLILPLLGIASWGLVSRGLRPLDRLARDVRTRTPNDLTPLAERDVPEEAQPLVHSLNGLLTRLGQAFETQRVFVADAAHELRTPLAALQIQLQLVERARDEVARREAVAELKQGLARAVHVVEQLLTLARQEPGSTEPAQTRVDLTALARQSIADYQALAAEKQIDLGLVADEADTIVPGDADGLRVLLGNLIANGIRYTPTGGRVDVVVRHDDQGTHLDVEDNGPGIPAADRERVFDRFYRLPGSESSGSGLGLAIVRTIADRHGASVRLTEGTGGGLRVAVLFPPAVGQKDAGRTH